MAFTSKTSPRLAASAALLGGILALWRWPGSPIALSFAATTATLWLLAFFIPRAYAPFHRVFEKIIQLILAVFTYTLLGLVYFLIFAPVGLWLKLRRHDPFSATPPTEGSYWQTPRPSTSTRAQH